MFNRQAARTPRGGKAGRSGKEFLPSALASWRLGGKILLLAAFVISSAVAEEPFFKKGDVIALVGGEDMVALSEYGYLELLLTRALPEHRLKFRNLAWEGDTVFEQRRDLNFPPLEAQLDQVGATVVLCQFGQMESLAGREKLPEFVAAYEKLIARMSGGGKRRIYVVAPIPFASSQLNETLDLYDNAIKDMAFAQGASWSQAGSRLVRSHLRILADPTLRAEDTAWVYVSHRDGIHLNQRGQQFFPHVFGDQLLIDIDPHRPWSYHHERIKHAPYAGMNLDTGELIPKALEQFRQIITAKNRLWFDYWRVQNWAFLAGDRTEQPSSRDHLDPTKRWFPAEREQFLPLIAAKEREIWALAAKLAQP